MRFAWPVLDCFSAAVGSSFTAALLLLYCCFTACFHEIRFACARLLAGVCVSACLCLCQGVCVCVCLSVEHFAGVYVSVNPEP
jgi:hypothetical protein